MLMPVMTLMLLPSALGPRNETSPTFFFLITIGSTKTALRLRKASLRVDHGTASPRRLYQIRVLLYQQSIVLLCLPVPDAVSCKHEIHLFQRSLIGLRIQSPDHNNGENVDAAEDVESTFCEFVKDSREQQYLKSKLAIFSIRVG